MLLRQNACIFYLTFYKFVFETLIRDHTIFPMD